MKVNNQAESNPFLEQNITPVGNETNFIVILIELELRSTQPEHSAKLTGFQLFVFVSFHYQVRKVVRTLAARQSSLMLLMKALVPG